MSLAKGDTRSQMSRCAKIFFTGLNGGHVLTRKGFDSGPKNSSKIIHEK